MIKINVFYSFLMKYILGYVVNILNGFQFTLGNPAIMKEIDKEECINPAKKVFF